MKFYVHRTHTVMSGLVIRWNPAGNLNAEISASREGVHISGYFVLELVDQRSELSKTISSAWNAYELLKRGNKPPRYENELDVSFGETLEEVVKRPAKDPTESTACDCTPTAHGHLSSCPRYRP